MSKTTGKPQEVPPQKQAEPGHEHQMHPEPEVIRPNYKGSGKLDGKVALITGGDSGIGRSVAVHFAREGAEVAIIYLSEHKDAQETRRLVEKEGKECLLIAGDVGDRDFCQDAIRKVVEEFGKINVLVNNAGEQHPEQDLQEMDMNEMEKTFRTNIFSMFYLTQQALKHMTKGDCIINTTSVTAFRGQKVLLDYSSTKGAITSFTRSLSLNLAEKGIRVNGVAPGPIWTPLIPSTFPEDKVKNFGKDTPLGRPGQPSEVAPAYVFLACDDASYISGQIIHPNGGEVINT
ncbi:MAG: SDR family oxidoreductase [Ignavibacteria bacterium]|jgi:NAD(P)-dependent dehydrogenase (short-subunit alcohol dehydrogenase family)|nr:SDR family oxidoreductase [Ignavibacteria bacterium]MCU7504483.1 SDR family oxidoreductase [Ignavibacteria bacterium]MCU7517938.1 SDR family oxidoreductase [Ignavibacteria bacterium]